METHDSSGARNVCYIYIYVYFLYMLNSIFEALNVAIDADVRMLSLYIVMFLKTCFNLKKHFVLTTVCCLPLADGL